MAKIFSSTKTLSLFSALALASTFGACDKGDSGGDEADGTESGVLTQGSGDTATTDAETGSEGESSGSTTDDGSSSEATTGEETTGEETTGAACSVPDPGWGAAAAVGQPAPHFEGPNQHGEMVNICQYAGVEIVIDTSAVWCGPCQMMSTCLVGPQYDQTCIDLFGGNTGVISQLINPLRAGISNGTIAWVTVLMENGGGGAPAQSDAANWDASYPNPDINVMPDVSQNYFQHLNISAFPSAWVIDANMNWLDLNSMGVWSTIAQVSG